MPDEVRREVDGQERKALVVTSAGEGTPDDPAWDGTDPVASGIAILKAIYAQNETIIGLLDDIKTNTAA